MDNYDQAARVQDVPWPEPGPTAIYDLAQILHTGVPHHPIHPAFAYTLTKKHGDVRYPDGVSSAGGQFMMGDHGGTHMDALNHVSWNGKIHKNYEVAGLQDYSAGVLAGSIHEAPPAFTTGHLVDIPHQTGGVMKPGEGVRAEHLEEWFRGRSLPEAGSAVLIRTGWDEYWNDMEKFVGVNSGLPGVALDAAEWLTDHEVAFTGTDTVAYEVMPSPSLEVHRYLLVTCGVYIIESMNLAGLSKDQHWEFFFAASALPIKGGTGSPLRPLAFIPLT